MELKRVKLFLAESMGVDQNYIENLTAEGAGLIFQFNKDVRGGLVADHCVNEYLYLNTRYGLTEIYDYIKADNLGDAILKMQKLNEEIENEKGAA